MTDKITKSLINSCKKLYEKNVISYESYIECSNKMKNKDVHLIKDSKLVNNYTEKNNKLYQQKKNTFEMYNNLVVNMINKLDNPTLENNKFIEENYNNLLDNIKEKINYYENKLLINDIDSKDIIYKTMLQRNQELNDKTLNLNNQINEIETMIDKNNIIKDKLSNNLMINKFIIIIIAVSVLFIFYKLLTNYKNKTNTDTIISV